MKTYKFADYFIKIYEKEDELPKQAEGCLSLCKNNLGKPVGIELIGGNFKPCVKEYVFCNLINRILRGDLGLVVEVK